MTAAAPPPFPRGTLCPLRAPVPPASRIVMAALAASLALCLAAISGCRWLRGGATYEEQRPLEKRPRSEAPAPLDPANPWEG
ncbi:MAG: hypothetical protein N3A38_07375 [Planctomycetota bacterium]|nr:hypothetical protein [Planctomycetota bacterium]